MCGFLFNLLVPPLKKERLAFWEGGTCAWLEIQRQDKVTLAFGKWGFITALQLHSSDQQIKGM